jgi:hypothetical protein
MFVSIAAWTLAILFASPSGDIRSAAIHNVLTGRARVIAAGVAAGALARLESPSCQQLLTDFDAGDGRSLVDSLAATGLSMSAHISRLYLVDGDLEGGCTNAATIAFTAPRSRVVHICSERFTAMFARRELAETLLIHEVLHTLGLGENPPTSADITRRVAARCSTANIERDRYAFALGSKPR